METHPVFSAHKIWSWNLSAMSCNYKTWDGLNVVEDNVRDRDRLPYVCYRNRRSVG